MNKFFAGRALGVKEHTEKFIPKALEDKDFMRNKTQISKDKSDRGNLKMKEFNKANPINKMTMFAGQKSIKKPNFNMKPPKPSSHNLKNLKTTSDVFLNTNFNKGDKKVKALKEKFAFYSNKGNSYKQKGIEKFTSKLNTMQNKKFKLPVKDYSSKNQQYGLTPRQSGVDTVYDEVVRQPQLEGPAETQEDIFNRAKKINPEIINAKFTDTTATSVPDLETYDVPGASTDTGVFSIDRNDTTEKLGAGVKAAGAYISEKGGNALKFMAEGVKNKYNDSQFAQDRERQAKYKQIKKDAREAALNDPSIQREYATRAMLAERNKLMKQADRDGGINKGFIQSGKETLGRFAGRGGLAAVLPNVTTDRFKELSGFIVGGGFRYAAASSVPKKPAALTVAEYTGRRSNVPAEAYQYQQQQPTRVPVEQGGDFKDIKRAYLTALIKKRLNSNSNISEKATMKLLKEIESLSVQDTSRPPRMSPPQRQPQQQSRVAQQEYQPTPQQSTPSYKTSRNVKKKDKGASDYQKQKALDLGYTIAPEDVDPRFGEKVIVQGEEKVVSPHGQYVSKLKGGYGELDTSRVQMKQVDYIQ